MPVYTVETTYHLPVYRQRAYDAVTPEDACRLAVDDDGWEDGSEDVDTSGASHVTGIWEGEEAYAGPAVPVPNRFGETVQRKAEMFDSLLSLLKEPGRPMGLSQHDFERWLPRALAAIAKAEEIVADAAGGR